MNASEQMVHHSSKRIETVSYCLMGAALATVLVKGLLVALLCGLLAYSLVETLSPFFERRFSERKAKYLAIALLVIVSTGMIAMGSWLAVEYFKNDTGSVQQLLQKLADIVEQSKNQIPEWLLAYIPRSADEIRDYIVDTLREHAGVAKTVGAQAGMIFIQVVLAAVIGTLIALTPRPQSTTGIVAPLTAAIVARTQNFATTFRCIVFAQVRISAINAVIIGTFLMGILPLFGIHLPLVKTMTVIAFVLGMMPIVGNTISNMILLLIGASYSLPVAVSCFLFMFGIHKLEYFLNATIMGGFIEARAWELLAAILVMDGVFGLPGVVAAPIYYGYLKLELRRKNLI